MDLGLKGKTAIVTGGASNLGRSITLTLAAEGANLVIADLDEPQALKVAAQARASGVRAIVIRTDVTNHLQLEQMVSRTLQEYERIHILINNVGWTIDRLFVKKPREEWEKEIKLNLWSTINGCRAVLDHMIEHKYGKIVNIGSDAGRMGEYNEAVYAACKGGVIALSKSLAREVGRYGINVNVVCPSLTPGRPEDTGEMSLWKTGDMSFTQDQLQAAATRYALRRLGTAQELANAAVFMASDAASFITGQTLSVNGGYTMM